MKKILLFTFLLLCTLPVSSKKAGEFTVLQWNIWQEGTSVPGGYEAIINEIVRLKPDFVTFRHDLLLFLQLRQWLIEQTSHYGFPDCISREGGSWQHLQIVIYRKRT